MPRSKSHSASDGTISSSWKAGCDDGACWGESSVLLSLGVKGDDGDWFIEFARDAIDDVGLLSLSVSLGRGSCSNALDG